MKVRFLSPTTAYDEKSDSDIYTSISTLSCTAVHVGFLPERQIPGIFKNHIYDIQVEPY